MQVLTITLDAIGTRLDQALVQAHPELSRAQWQRLIKDEQVTFAGKPLRANLKLKQTVTVDVILPDPTVTSLTPEDIPLDIRYEDDDLVVVNKPAGMVVHPSVGHEGGTLVHAILHHYPDLPGIGEEMRPGIVHRLDKDTSGLIVVAKNESTLNYLQDQFRERTIQKTYLALVDGIVNPSEAVIDAPLGRDPKQRKKMSVIRVSSLHARPAQTHYDTLQTYSNHTLLICHPFTGRTHQIRVHLAHIGYPIVGDLVYGRRKQKLLTDRHFLHAYQLTFQRPADNETITLKAELPAELENILAQLST